jgi:DNA processing protein
MDEKLTGREILIYLCIDGKGDWDKVYGDIKRKRDLVPSEVRDVVSKCPYPAVTMLDPDYPDCFRRVDRPPFVLFYKGNFSLASYPHLLGVVGTRHPDAYGKEVTSKLVGEYCRKNPERVVVSGMAEGIDALAEKTALENGCRIVSVLGSGIDVCYPSSSRALFDSAGERSLLLSEYPSGVRPAAEHFPVRNRLIAGLSEVLLVTEGKMHSGTSITAHFALENNKDIACVPGSILSEFDLCNAFIREGAYPILETKDLEDLFRK